MNNNEPQQTAVSPPASFDSTNWHHQLIYPLLIAIKVTLLFLAIASLIQTINTTVNWRTLTGIVFLATLEGVYSSRWLYSYNQIITNRALYRLAELILIAFIIRIYAWFTLGNGLPDLATIQQYLRYPLDFFEDPFFLISLSLVILAWQRGITFGTLFYELAISRAEKAYFNNPQRDRWHNDAPIRAMRGLLVQRFFQQWLWGGVLLIICVGLSTFELNEAASLNLFDLARRSLHPSLLLIMLLYFLIGFWLLGQARLAMLNGRWLFEGVVANPKLTRNWSRSSLWTLLLLALLAAFIPIGSSLPASRLLLFLFNGVVYIMNLLFYLIALLFTGLMVLLFGGLGGNNEGGSEPPPPPPPPPPDLPPAAASNHEMLAMMLSSFFWAALLVGTAVAILFVLRGRGHPFRKQFWQQLWHNLLEWLHELRAEFSSQISNIKQLLQAPATEPELTPKQPSRWRFLRLNALSPRDQIRYFYLSTVKRAGQRGVRRQQHQTPLEYAQQLKTGWPEANEEIEQLTTAFLHAQYSPQPVTDETIPRVKQWWQQLKRQLRRQRNNNQ